MSMRIYYFVVTDNDHIVGFSVIDNEKRHNTAILCRLSCSEWANMRLTEPIEIPYIAYALGRSGRARTRVDRVKDTV